MTNFSAIYTALSAADGFIAGFDIDELQEGLPETIMAQIEAARVAARAAEDRAASLCATLRDVSNWLAGEGDVAGIHEMEILARVNAALAPLPAESTAAPTPTAESKPRLACPNCGDETHIYARCDARWNPETGGWIALELEDELDCTECDHAWPCPNELKP